MTRLLAPPLSWKGYATTIVAGTLATLAWVIGSYAALRAVGVEVTSVLSPERSQQLLHEPSGLAIIWVNVVVEEGRFRVPLALAALFGRQRLLPPAIAAFSIMFGLAHGAFPHVLIQGGAGVVLSLVFLRCGGFHRDGIHRPEFHRHIGELYLQLLRGWACSTASHGLWDTSLWIVAFFGIL